MTQQETSKILLLITKTFPNIELRQGTVEAWHSLIGDLPFDIVLAATKKVLQEQDYPALPAIGKIRKAAIFLSSPYAISAPEAWASVLSAIRYYGYPGEKKALESMSGLTRKAVEAVGWRDICLSENIDTVRAQFRMAYETLERREQELSIMSDDLLKLRQGNVKAINSGPKWYHEKNDIGESD